MDTELLIELVKLASAIALLAEALIKLRNHTKVSDEAEEDDNEGR